MNYEELEDWALRAAEALQQFCDEAQEASGNPDGEDQLRDIRKLIEEHHRIESGLPAWQSQIQTSDEPSGINFGD